MLEPLPYTIDDLYTNPVKRALEEPVPNAQNVFEDGVGIYTLPSQGLSSQALPIQEYAPAAGATVTLDLRLGSDHRVLLPSGGNVTLAVKNAVEGQRFIVSVTQSSTTRLVTWFSTIRWADGTEPTLSATADKRDTFGFIATSPTTFDGFILGMFI